MNKRQEYQAKWQRANRERLALEAKERGAVYRRDNKERIAKEAKERGIRNKYEKYNMTKEQIEEYNNTVACQVCGKETLICIDHDHNTGNVRGFLCMSCNVALGFVKDDVSILEKLISYLRGNKNG